MPLIVWDGLGPAEILGARLLQVVCQEALQAGPGARGLACEALTELHNSLKQQPRAVGSTGQPFPYVVPFPFKHEILRILIQVV